MPRTPSPLIAARRGATYWAPPARRLSGGPETPPAAAASLLRGWDGREPPAPPPRADAWLVAACAPTARRAESSRRAYRVPDAASRLRAHARADIAVRAA